MEKRKKWFKREKKRNLQIFRFTRFTLAYIFKMQKEKGLKLVFQ